MSAYLDGELEPQPARAAAEHLDQCRDCPPEAEAIAELRRALRGLGTPPVESVQRLRAWISEMPATGLAGGPAPG